MNTEAIVLCVMIPPVHTEHQILHNVCNGSDGGSTVLLLCNNVFKNVSSVQMSQIFIFYVSTLQCFLFQSLFVTILPPQLNRKH